MAQAGPHQNAQAGETASSLRFCAFRSGLRRPSSGAARLLLGATVLVSAVPACSFLHAREGPPRAAFVFHSPGRHGERRAACSPMPRSVLGYAASRMPVRSPAPRAVGRALDRAARPAGWTCLFGGSVGGGFLPDDDAWGEDELWQSETGEEPGADWRTVLLRDEKLNRTIECFVDREVEVEGKEYVTLIPADTPVIMAGYKTVNGSQQLVPVLDDHTIGELFPTASAVLSEMDLLLTRSAVVLTVEEVEDSIDTSDSDEVDDDDDDDERVVVIDLGRGGEASLPLSMFEDDEDDSSEFDDEDVIPIAESDSGVIGLRRGELIDREAGETDTRPRLGSEDDEDLDDSSEDESEKVQVLANFLHNGEKYVVATPLEPVLIIGSPAESGLRMEPALRPGSDLDAQTISSLPGAGGILGEMQDAEESNRAQYVLPDREELERVTPKIEAQLETIWNDEEKERKVLGRLRQQLINQWQRSD